MIIAVDTETEGLNAQKYLLGCVIKETDKKPVFFRDKNKLWEYILELGEIEKRKKRNLYVYAHNHEFDFCAYADKTDKKLREHGSKIFLMTRENIKFIDSMLIYRMALKDVGRIIGIEKLAIPEELRKGKVPENKKEREEFFERTKIYLERDTLVCLESILKIKERLKDDKILVRSLISIGQISINHFINFLRKTEYGKSVLKDKRRGEFFETENKEEVHNAYRGGRVEAFKLGYKKRASSVDVNSLYPYISTMIPFPDLRTEVKIKTPLKFMSLEKILNKIGVSKVRIITAKGLGVLPVRYKDKNHYEQREGIELIGTWTNFELKKAVEEGYKIKDVEFSIFYDEAENPFKIFIKDLYELRIKSKDSFSYFYYKQLMNNVFGKLGQRNESFVSIWDARDYVQEYKEKGFEVKQASGTDYKYTKVFGVEYPRFYTPIIPAYINAYGRILLYESMKNMKEEDLLYCDTDSIIFTGKYVFDIGKNIGQWKKEFENVEYLCYSMKGYKIGNQIKLSGVSKMWINEKNFKEGIIRHKKMIGLKKDTDKAGLFRNEVNDLNESRERHEEYEREIKGIKSFVDEKEKDINYFL